MARIRALFGDRVVAEERTAGAEMTGRRARFAVLLAAALVAGGLVGDAAHAQTVVAIHGKVLDQNGRAVESAQVALSPGDRRALSLDDGSFEIPGLRSGEYVLSARRIGYQPASRTVTLRDSAVAVTITLVAIPAQLDSIHIREKLSGIRYSAVVLDQNDAPVAGAEVVAIGVNSNLTTDSLGRFTVPDLSRGTLAVRIRKIGYAAFFDSFHLFAERADTLRMARLAESLTPVEVKEASGFGMDFWAYRDLESRQAWKGAMAGAISREELDARGKLNLCDALPGTPSGVKLSLHNDPKCKWFPEGMRNILVDGAMCRKGLLSDYDADQVEYVEVMPADMSGSLVARHCGPPTFVIWTRKSADHQTVSAAKIAEAEALLEGSVPGADATRSIAGIVFDSVANRPLSGAHVHLADLGRDTVADSLGTFRFDNVGAGVHAVWADHPTLDLLGLNALGARVDVTPQAVTTANLAIPSFATLWRLACGRDSVPRDGDGFVFGRVRASGVASGGGSGASLAMTWRQATPSGTSAPAAEARRTVQADGTGSYAVCGIPGRQVVTISSSDSGVSTVPVSFRVSASRITRRDVTLPSGGLFEQIVSDTSSAALVQGPDAATVAGGVRDSAGHALRDVRITVSGVSGEWRTSAAGGFVVRGVPAGTHVVAFNGIGFVRERRLVELAAQDSATLELSMTRLLTTLPTVTVEERRRFDALKSDLESRRRMGFGYRADSLELARLPGVREAFNFPGVHTGGTPMLWGINMTGVYSISSKGSTGITMTCDPAIWIDGGISDMDMLRELGKDEIGLIEVYTSAAGAPMQYAGSRTNCGVVLVWRKRFINP